MKKLNLLLTISLVSLFISFILISVGNSNKYCQSFGFLFLAVTIATFVAEKAIETTKQIDENNKNIDEAIDNKVDSLIIYEAEMENKKLNKMRISLIMGAVVFVFLLVVLAFVTAI